MNGLRKGILGEKLAFLTKKIEKKKSEENLIKELEALLKLSLEVYI